MKKQLHGIARLSIAGWAIGCAGPAEIPDLPSLDELEREYDEPTAELQPNGIRDVIGSVPQLDRLLAAFRSTSNVIDAVNEASVPAEEVTGDGVGLRGSLRVDLRCPGALTMPAYDPERNGSVSLTLGVARSKILRDVVGDASECRLTGNFGGFPIEVVLDGPIGFDLGQDIPLGQPWSGRRWLVALGGSISVDDVSFSSVSARVSPAAVEHLQRLSDGSSVVLSASASGISLRDAESTWSCDKSGVQCERD